MKKYALVGCHNYDIKTRNYDIKSQNYGLTTGNYDILNSWNYDIKSYDKIMTKVKIT